MHLNSTWVTRVPSQSKVLYQGAQGPVQATATPEDTEAAKLTATESTGPPECHLASAQ